MQSIGLRNISSYEITACHRIVRFTNRKAVDFALRNRDLLHEKRRDLNMNLRFYESFCRANEETVRECFKLKKDGIMEDYFIRNGFVKIVKKNGDRPYKINHPL